MLFVNNRNAGKGMYRPVLGGRTQGVSIIAWAEERARDSGERLVTEWYIS